MDRSPLIVQLRDGKTLRRELVPPQENLPVVIFEAYLIVSKNVSGVELPPSFVV